MNLIAQIGRRAVYTPAEVCAQTGLTDKQLRRFVDKGCLQKRGVGKFPYLQKDVNTFLVRLNAGEIG